MSVQNINTYTYSPGFQLGQYHNAVLCISGNVQSLYLDGNLIATKIGTTNVLANYSNINKILIGCAGDQSSGFSGYLDDFRMYNYTLNQTQVSNLYLNRNMVAYYPFDNSLNSQTPNYTTLAYDANLVGNATISTSSQIGGGALQITNTTGSATKSYVTSSSGFSTLNTNGLSISLWFKVSGVSSTRMRLFDLCTALGSQGISVDINGTNQILAGDGYYVAPAIITTSALGPIDNLSTAAYNAMVYNGTKLQAGAYGIALLHSKYTGPSIQIKNGSSGTPTDFYPALDGTSTLKTSSGTSLTSFLSGAIAYVTKWYDQTGNANHATAAGTTLPTLDTTNNVVDFGSTGYFTLLDGSYPTGNSPYTYVFKQGSVASGSCVVFKGGSGISNNNGYLTYFTRSDNYLVHQWSGGALEQSGTASSTTNSVMVCTYLEGTSYPSIYKNNVNIPMSANGIIRNQDATQNYLGSYGDGTFTYKSTMPYFYWLPYQLGSSDRDILGNTTYYSAVSYLPLISNTLDIGTNPQTINTSGTITYTTIAGKQCAFFNNSSSSNANRLYFNFTNYPKFTLSFWVYYIGSSNTVICITNGASQVLADYYDNNKMQFYIALPNQWKSTTDNSCPGNQWNHIIYSVDQTSYVAKIYINGTLISTLTGTGVFSGSTINVGADSIYRGLNGYMRQFQHYNSILTDAQIQNIYTTTG